MTAPEQITDHTQLQVGDLLEYRCPRFAIVTQWRIEGIHLGGMGAESVIEISSVTRRQSVKVMMVPEQMVRDLTAWRPRNDL